MAEIIAIAVLVFIHRILVKAFQGFRSERTGGDADIRLTDYLKRIKSTSAHTDGCTFKRAE